MSLVITLTFNSLIIIATDMFYEAATCRKIVTEKNYDEPLTEKEIYAATRIQLRRNLLSKEFAFEERPFRT